MNLLAHRRLLTINFIVSGVWQRLEHGVAGCTSVQKLQSWKPGPPRNLQGKAAGSPPTRGQRPTLRRHLWRWVSKRAPLTYLTVSSRVTPGSSLCFWCTMTLSVKHGTLFPCWRACCVFQRWRQWIQWIRRTTLCWPSSSLCMWSLQIPHQQRSDRDTDSINLWFVWVIMIMMIK